MADPAAGGQIPDLPRIDRGLGVEVEAFERAYAREAGELHAHLDASAVAAGDLALGQEQQRFAQRHLRPAGFVEQAVELVADRSEPQPGE